MIKKVKKLFKELKTVLSKSQWNQLMSIIAVMLGMSILETLTVSLMYPFIYMILGTESDDSIIILLKTISGFSTSNQLIVFISFLLVLTYLVKGICAYYSNYLQCTWVAKTKTELSIKTFNTIMHKPYSFHLNSGTAIINYIVIQNIDRLFNLISSVMLLIADGLTGLLIITYLFVKSPTITIISMAILGLVYAFFGIVLKKRINQYGIIYREQNIGMMKWILQSVGGLKGIYVNKKQEYFVRNYAKSTKACFYSFKDYNILAALPKIITENFSMVIIFAIVGFMGIQKTAFISILPLIGTFAMAAIKLIPICNHINSAVYGVTYNKNSLDEILRIFKNENECTEEDSEKDYKPEQLKNEILVNNITFKYPDAEKALFDGISLRIPVGKSIAFIGTTGAGKTTLADIILGLHSVESGEILVDGHNIIKEKEWWSKQLGYIPQYIYLCDDSIRANVAFGVNEDQIDDNEVWSCLEKAQLKDYVMSLPQGLDTITGENGIRLSGGQRQRIGIARALYGNPPFIILDEATSSLDYETEAAIIDAIDCLAGDKTLLIIAHRLNTIKNCDIIYRIENGIIKEENKEMIIG